MGPGLRRAGLGETAPGYAVVKPASWVLRAATHGKDCKHTLRRHAIWVHDPKWIAAGLAPRPEADHGGCAGSDRPPGSQSASPTGPRPRAAGAAYFVRILEPPVWGSDVIIGYS